MTLARPELGERHPDWAAGKRDFTSLFLEPLAPEAMDELLRGLVPGLPEELRDRIRERAEGVPLYAVETVRMLLDRGLLERDGDDYRLTGAIEALEVPETLHALIAARLDGLPKEERRLLDDASVLGKTFTKSALAALSRFPEPELEPLLASLVRKEILVLQADPRSPERGQYGFLQALVQKVAHDTLSKREQKARHLAAAEFFETSWASEGEEIAEVIASHYLDAYRTDPAAEDATAIKSKARERLTRAGERAGSLAAHTEAQRYYEQAAELADEPLEQAALLERAGDAAHVAAAMEDAISHFERAIELYETTGRTHAAGRVSAELGLCLWITGRADEARARMEESFAILAGDEPDEDFAAFAAELARLDYFAGNLERAFERIEQALKIAEALWLPGVVSEALNTKSLVLHSTGRRQEGIALLRHSLALALEEDVPLSALRAYFNLAHQLNEDGRYRDAQATDYEGLALARRLGNRRWEIQFLHHLAGDQFFLGEWDEALTVTDELVGSDDRWAQASNALWPRPLVEVERGDTESARARVEAWELAADDLQERLGYDNARAAVLLAAGNPAEALQAAEAAFAARAAQGMHIFVQQAFAYGVQAALALGDADRAERLLAEVRALPPGETPPPLRAQSARFAARLAALVAEHERVEPSFDAAENAFRNLETPFWLAATQLEHAEWLAGRGRAAEAEPLLAEAREIFERLKARPWLERLDRLEVPAAAAAAS
jgi:tetratricopeptide (TPR) repeat protein